MSSLSIWLSLFMELLRYGFASLLEFNDYCFWIGFDFLWYDDLFCLCGISVWLLGLFPWFIVLGQWFLVGKFSSNLSSSSSTLSISRQFICFSTQITLIFSNSFYFLPLWAVCSFWISCIILLVHVFPSFVE